MSQGSTLDQQEELAALRARLADVERRLDALESRPTAHGEAPAPWAPPLIDAAEVARLASVYRSEGLSRTLRDGAPGRHAQHLVLVERRGLVDLADRVGAGTPFAAEELEERLRRGRWTRDGLGATVAARLDAITRRWSADGWQPGVHLTPPMRNRSRRLGRLA